MSSLLRYRCDKTHYIKVFNEKYFKVWNTLFIFELDDTIYSILKELTDVITSVIYIPIIKLDSYETDLKKLFDYAIFHNQYYVNRIGIVAETKDLVESTRKVITNSTRTISSTKEKFPLEENVLLVQKVKQFKASMAESNNGINTTIFIRSSDSYGELKDLFNNISSNSTTHDYTLSFEIRQNKLIGTLSTGVILGIYTITASKIVLKEGIIDE